MRVIRIDTRSRTFTGDRVTAEPAAITDLQPSAVLDDEFLSLGKRSAATDTQDALPHHDIAGGINTVEDVGPKAIFDQNAGNARRARNAIAQRRGARIRQQIGGSALQPDTARPRLHPCRGKNTERSVVGKAQRRRLRHMRVAQCMFSADSERHVCAVGAYDERTAIAEVVSLHENAVSRFIQIPDRRHGSAPSRDGKHRISRFRLQITGEHSLLVRVVNEPMDNVIPVVEQLQHAIIAAGIIHGLLYCTVVPADFGKPHIPCAEFRGKGSASRAERRIGGGTDAQRRGKCCFRIVQSACGHRFTGRVRKPIDDPINISRRGRYLACRRIAQSYPT